jgi:hypothetical protein
VETLYFKLENQQQTFADWYRIVVHAANEELVIFTTQSTKFDLR